MGNSCELQTLLGEGIHALLERLDEGIMILDQDRTLRFANARARSLLGYAEGEAVGGRCRHSARGVDCEDACPLTFALASGHHAVERFSTVYRGRDERPVALDVTLIPLRNANGEFQGAVEILRPTSMDPGFMACGRSDRARRLRRDIERLAGGESALLIVGDLEACVDVAEAIHRASRLDKALFFKWPGSWDDVPLWPPGTMYAMGDEALRLVDDDRIPPGWRVIGGVRDELLSAAKLRSETVVLRLPQIAEVAEDLPAMVAALVARMKPTLTVSAEALERLCRLWLADGIDRLHEVLAVAVAAADGMLGNEHLQHVGSRSVLMDELLASPEPLAAMENRILEEVLVRCGWRMQDAADRLGISRVTLWRKLKEHGIERPGSDD